MEATSCSEAATSQRVRWWLEPQLWGLVLLATLIHGARLTTPGLRGEETRRGQVAVEMIQTGDWVAPRQQGELFFSRPPLQNWLIAGVGLLRGEVDLVAIRLPSLVSTVLLGVVVYWYTRRITSATAALVAGLAWATAGQVLELGRLGETEALFALLVAGSILIWHAGFVDRWPRYVTYGVGYALAGLGMLTKGPQAPAYFVAAMGVYLLATRQWRELYRGAHLFGVAVFLLVWNAWQVPYLLQEGLVATRRVYGNDVALRFVDMSWSTILTHLATFPLEVFACLLPWAVLLPVLAYRGFWDALDSRRKATLWYLLGAIAITLPTCWFTPGGKTRYFLPLYPAFAVIAGVIAEACWKATAPAFWHGAWRRTISSLAVAMAAVSIAMVVLPWVPAAEALALSPAATVIYAALIAASAAVAWIGRRGESARQQWQAAVAVSLFLGVVYMGPATTWIDRFSNDASGQVAELKQQLPPQTQLVSLGEVDHVFMFHYRTPVAPLPSDEAAQRVAAGEYFCFMVHNGKTPEVGFPWQPVGEVNCDRGVRAQPERLVIVGRRQAEPKTAAAASPTLRR